MSGQARLLSHDHAGSGDLPRSIAPLGVLRTMDPADGSDEGETLVNRQDSGPRGLELGQKLLIKTDRDEYTPGRALRPDYLILGRTTLASWTTP